MSKRGKTDASVCDKLMRTLGPIHHFKGNTMSIESVREVRRTIKGLLQISSLFKQK